MMPWGRALSTRNRDYGDWRNDGVIFRIPVMRHSCGVSATLDIAINTDVYNGSLDPAAASRLYCLWLISTMNERGLSETQETLESLVEFYAKPPYVSLPPPSIVSVPVIMGTATVRKVYPIDPEDL